MVRMNYITITIFHEGRTLKYRTYVGLNVMLPSNEFNAESALLQDSPQRSKIVPS
jgi:hypothetical protein